ncbi:MAG: PBSX family phage terminase large subunit, partial [Pseudothermotoga sp.]
ICNADAFINILEGSVRSGKTIASIVAWIEYVRTSPHTKFLMTGNTSDTLYRNVIEDIENILGDMVRYNKSSKGGAKLIFKFPNLDYPAKSKKRHIHKICYCVGAHDERSENKIRGLTVAGWYADEITLHPESFVKQAINRMSLAGARAFWTTNPDSPYHFIKTEFIDKAKEKGYKVWHFELDDNLALSKEYKENLKKAYAGVWYKRMVLGLWVLAEGIIYDMFNEELHVVDHLPAMSRWYISIDYGTANPTVFSLMGISRDGNWYIAKEYYYDGRKSMRQKTDSEYSKDLQQFIKDCGVIPSAIFIDPSAASFIVQLRKDGVKGIKQADNEVLDGIRKGATLLGQKKLFVHRSCVNHRREFQSYSWDPKAPQKGIDQPLKENDHSADAVRYCINSVNVKIVA